MHERMLGVIVNVCRGRIREGDHPTVRAFSVEQLEEAVVELADKLGLATKELTEEEWAALSSEDAIK